MELFVVLVALALLLLLLVGGVLAIIAFVLALGHARQIRDLQREIRSLLNRVGHLEARTPEAEPEPAEEPATKPTPPPPIPPEPAPKPPAWTQPQEQGRAAAPGEPAPAPARSNWAGIEQAIGQKWLTWAGVLALLAAAGFFLKYAFDQQWIGPTTRVLMGLLAGIVMLGTGERFVRRGSRFFGQGLIGGGLALLYLSLFASFTLYRLVPQPVAFAAMVVVTLVGMALAVAHDSLSISFLAVLGGLLTPVLLSTGEDRRDVLFAYLLLLDLGVLGLTLSKRWRALDVLAFVGTAALFAGWFAEFYADAAWMPALLWLLVFYALFLVLACLDHLRRRTPIRVERFAVALANAALVFACACTMLHEQHEFVLGSVALGMAASYLGLAVLAGRRLPDAKRPVFGFVGLAMVFFTVSAPFYLDGWAVTLAWAAEGPLLVYLGYRFRYMPVRAGGFLVLVLSAMRIAAVHWPLHETPFVAFWNEAFLCAFCVPLAGAAAALVHRFFRHRAEEGDRTLKLALVIGGAYLALLLVHSELANALSNAGKDWLAHHVGAAPWTGGAALLLVCGLLTRSRPVRLAGLLPLTVGGVLMLVSYGYGNPGDYLVFLNVRFAAGLVAVIAAFAYRLLPGRMDAPLTKDPGGTTAFWAGLMGLPLLLSMETYSYFSCAIADAESARWTALTSVSVVWTVYASALLVVGFRRNLRSIRVTGLALFGAVALKVVLVDLGALAQVYRIVSFFVLGALMIAGAYLYHRIEQRMERSTEQPP